MKPHRIDFTTMTNLELDRGLMDTSKKISRAGRKRAITPEMAPVIRMLRSQGHGYRSIAKTLYEQYDTRLHWSRVRDFVKGRSCYQEPQYLEK